MWWKESVVYQIYPRSFKDSNGDGIGDLRGIIQKIDYLKELGIDVIWLSPIYKSPNDDNGYDISDYQDIMEEFGSMADFDALLHEAHAKGIKILLDLVVNHTSDEHVWFAESRKSVDNPYRDYYIWKSGEDGKAPNNWGSSFGGPAWEYDAETGMYYLHLYSVKQPDLNWDNPKVRHGVYDMMRWWLDKGIDGFRMDVINLISKDEHFPDAAKGGHEYGDFYPIVANGPKIHNYLKEMNKEVLSKYDIMTVGEMPMVTVEHARKYTSEAENELNMVFHFEHMGVDTGEHGRWCDRKMYLPDLKAVMTKWQTGLYNEGWNSLYWNNHDQPRVVSRFGNDTAYREVSAKMLGTCLHFMQGTPYIYQGEELGMTNIKFEKLTDYKDIDTLNSYHQFVEVEGMPHDEMMRYIYKKSRDNARTPMQWDDSEHAGFTTGEPWIAVNPNHKTINASKQMEDPDSVFNYYKRLIELRKKYPVIVYGQYELLDPDNVDLYVYKRTYKEETLIIICSFKEQEVPYALDGYDLEDAEILISNYPVEDDNANIVLKPYEARVYYKHDQGHINK
jgi:oligo-1,6-glucosidase